MALRAGYYGIKKNILSTINRLSGAKIIKTIGDGLKLTSAGKLSCDIDTDKMEFKSGKLSVKAVSTNYSTDEVETGQKWVDGRSIYMKTYILDSVTVQIENLNNIDLLDAEGTVLYKYQSDMFRCVLGSFSNAFANVYYNEVIKYVCFGANLDISRFSELKATIYYVKKEGE